MSRLWLRSEVFDGVLPLRSSGIPLSPARAMGAGAGAPSPLFVLLKALREANPDTVRCVGVSLGLLVLFCIFLFVFGSVWFGWVWQA